MLADEMIAATGTGAMAKEMGVDMAGIAEAIRDAARFDLMPGVIATAHVVRDSPLDARLKALTLTRLPFARTWFEWPGGIGGPGTIQDETRTRPVPRRMGALVETDESLRRGSIDFCWVQDDMGGINLCPLRVTFDWNEEPQPVEDAGLTGIRADIAAGFVDRLRHATDRDSIRRSSDAALLLDNERFGVVLSPYWRRCIARLILRQQFSAITAMLESAMRDITGEADILRSVIMCLNSRNMTRASYQPAPERLNKQRARKGRAPLLDTTTIRIKLSPGLAARVGNGGERNASKAHVVRGHFKIRRSGVYWWSPFLRGEGKGNVAPSQYQVVP